VTKFTSRASEDTQLAWPIVPLLVNCVLGLAATYPGHGLCVRCHGICVFAAIILVKGYPEAHATAVVTHIYQEEMVFDDADLPWGVRGEIYVGNRMRIGGGEGFVVIGSECWIRGEHVFVRGDCNLVQGSFARITGRKNRAWPPPVESVSTGPGTVLLACDTHVDITGDARGPGWHTAPVHYWPLVEMSPLAATDEDLPDVSPPTSPVADDDGSLRQAALEELQSVPGLPPKVGRELYGRLRRAG